MVNPSEFRGSFSGRERDVFFLNRDEAKGFDEVGYGLGLNFADDGRSVAPVDVDGDGDLDLAFQSLQQLRLLRNPLVSKTHFLRVRLKAKKTQHHALGAEVIVKTKNAEQRDYVKITAGFQTQVPLDLHFGLGKESKIEELRVKWPSGAQERFTEVAIDRLLTIVEGEGRIEVKELPTWSKENAPPVSRPYSLKARAKVVSGKVEKEIGVQRRINVINFWAPWCKPCAEELPAFGKLAKKYKSIAFAGVSVETQKLDDVKQAIAEHGLAYPQFLANPALMESFFGADGEAPLPATLVFNKNGALVRSFFRAITAEELSQTLEALEPDQSDAKMLRWMGEHAVAQGYLSSGVSFFQKGLEEDPDSVLLLVQLGGTLSGQEQHKKAIALLEKATRLDPRFPYAWHLLGKAYSRADKLKKSMKAHRKATALQSEDPSYWLSLGAVYMRLKKGKEGLAAFEKATELDPRNVLAWLNLAKTRAIMKKPKVVEAFDRVLNLVPEHEEALMLKQRFIEVQALEAGVPIQAPPDGSAPAVTPGLGAPSRQPF